MKLSQDKDRIKEAVNHAVSAIYFNDNSDYLSSLYEIVKCLTDIEDLNEETIKKIFKELNDE